MTQEINAIQYSTFKALPWFGYPNRIFIGGAGGIGSWLSLMLARAGFSIEIWDFDIIEERNLGGQFYLSSDLNSYKVSALTNLIKSFSPSSYIRIQKRRVEMSSSVFPFAFSAFDNMEARRDMFEAWSREVQGRRNRKNAIFIDGRLEAEFFQIYCVRNVEEDIQAYKRTLADNNSNEDVMCSMKQTTHIAAMIASYMVAFFTNHLTNIAEKGNVRFIPFKFEVFTPLVKIIEYGTDDV